MACTRKLMFMILAGLAPLLVRGLQAEPTASSAAAASQLSQIDDQHPVPKKKRVLLIVAGLARHMEVTWPALEKAVVVPNEQAGYTFEVVFTTNASLECHRDSPRWNSRCCEDPGSNPKEHVDRIKKFFGQKFLAPRNVEVLHDTKVCVPRPPASYDSMAAPPCAPWWERVHRVLAKVVESGEKFDRVVALRPDIVLRPSTSCKDDKRICSYDPFVEPPHLLLDKMCAQKPGFSFVNPNYLVQHKSYLHDKDLDFMHILCPGEELPAYEEAIRVPGERCSPGPYPPLPPGFHSSKGWHDQAFFCRFVQVFTDRNVSISHWDDTYFVGWPHPTSFNVLNEIESM